jgi:hypothetical protein
LSTEQAIPETPDGPAAAVAVTYCTPAVEGASVGPESTTLGCSLSTARVLPALAQTLAAFSAWTVTCTAPFAYRVVSTV